MKIAFIACCTLLLCVAAFGQDVQQQCGPHPDLARDSSCALKWLTPDEVQNRVRTIVLPEPVPMPNGAVYTGVIGAKIMVSTSGDVVCLWGVSGHPVLIPAAIRALHQWKFRPMVVSGKQVEFVGQVRVPVRSKN